MSKFKYDLGIIGLGYVGLPLAVYSIDAGLKVFGYDINSEKVLKLNQGCLLYTSPSPRDGFTSRMPSSA